PGIARPHDHLARGPSPPRRGLPEPRRQPGCGAHPLQPYACPSQYRASARRELVCRHYAVVVGFCTEDDENGLPASERGHQDRLTALDPGIRAGRQGAGIAIYSRIIVAAHPSDAGERTAEVDPHAWRVENSRQFEATGDREP